jgi:NAD(P)-dependent dehydrogenase (short-subunit alcohol dehydrogenase family)
MATLFQDKLAFITGGAFGIGLATARAFADAGASIAVVDRDLNAARSAAELVQADGHAAIAIASWASIAI